MKKTSIVFVLTIALLMGAISSGIAAEEKFPSKTINVINPFLPGGWLDLSVRPIVEEMGKKLGVTVITTPMPGAGGSIGYTKVAQAHPDGYTLMLSVGTTMLTNGTLRNVRYNPESYVAIAAYCLPPNALIIKEGDSRFKTLKEFIAYAKEHPNELSLGMSGTRNTATIGAALLEKKAGVKFKWVPFNGAVAVNSAVASGHVDAGITQTLASSGILGLMMFGEHQDSFPDIPTAKELGYNIEWNDYTGIFAPKGLSPEKRKILEAAVLAAADSPVTHEVVKNMKMNFVLLNSEQFEKELNKSHATLKELITEGYIKPEDK